MNEKKIEMNGFIRKKYIYCQKNADSHRVQYFKKIKNKSNE